MTTPFTAQTDAPDATGEEFEVLLISDGVEPGYSVFCPSLPGCISQGDDWDDALAMITEAIEGFLECGPRPAIRGDEKEQMMRDWIAIGCQVETARVLVNLRNVSADP